MGMTIDQSINQIIDSLIGEKANLLNHSDRVALTDALNTMRKYQKIEQILDDCLLDDWEILKSIREVLEDATN